MDSKERDEFNRQLRVLFAGWNVLPTPERLDAYWRGLNKMGLMAFVRLIEECLGENGTEKLPTVHVFWELYKARGRFTPVPVGPALPDPVMAMPHHRRLCCLWFLTRCRRAGGFKAGEAWITKLRIAAQRGADEWQVMRDENDPEATNARLYSHLDRILADWQIERAS